MYLIKKLSFVVPIETLASIRKLKLMPAALLMQVNSLKLMKLFRGVMVKEKQKPWKQVMESTQFNIMVKVI